MSSRDRRSLSLVDASGRLTCLILFLVNLFLKQCISTFFTFLVFFQFNFTRSFHRIRKSQRRSLILNGVLRPLKLAVKPPHYASSTGGFSANCENVWGQTEFLHLSPTTVGMGYHDFTRGLAYTEGASRGGAPRRTLLKPLNRRGKTNGLSRKASQKCRADSQSCEMNVENAKRQVHFLTTLDKCDTILIQHFSNFSFKKLVRRLNNTTFEERQGLGRKLAHTVKRRRSIFHLLVRSMTRWVVRNQDESTQSSTASLQILGGAPASGKSSLECMNKSKSVVTYDSDADKLRILYLLKMVPKMFTTEAELCLFLDGSIEIGWIGDYLQPLQRALRPEIFKCLAELCYDVRIIGLHSSVQAIEETANAFRKYQDLSVHLVDIFDQPDEQARRLKKRADSADHFAILPFSYARRAASSVHEMVQTPELGRLASSRNAEVLLTTVCSFRATSGRCRTSTEVLFAKNTTALASVKG